VDKALSNTKFLDEGFLRIIRTFAFPVIWVRLDKRLICSCVNHVTKEAKIDCQRCFGTGHRIFLRKIDAYLYDKQTGFKSDGFGEQSINTYYVDGKYSIGEDHYIVDGERVSVVYRVEEKRTASSQAVFYKIYVAPKKSHANLFAGLCHGFMTGGENSA